MQLQFRSEGRYFAALWRRAIPIFVLVCLGVGQTLGGRSLPSSAPADCSDPALANTPACATAHSPASGAGRDDGTTGITTPVLKGSPNSEQNLPEPPVLNPSQRSYGNVPLRPETEFQQLVADSVGRVLPLFGQSLFVQAPSTFAPMDRLQVPADYLIGPGDELQVRMWGQVEADLRLIVDRAGQIYIPQVGPVTVAGIHAGELEQHLKNEISRVFRNFNVTAGLGRLRSIQILVVGDARYPGTYTISSLSTLVNAIFASGGPSAQGSLRHIQVRREGAVVTDFDFYDLLIKGDKSKDVRLQPGDVLFIPHVGPLVAIAGSVNSPSIYEMREDSTLNDLIDVAGGLTNVADSQKITVDRIADQSRKTLAFPLDPSSGAIALKNGDIVRVYSIVPRFEDTVTLRGNVANPGRYPWKPGMRVRDLIPDAQALLTREYWRDRAAISTGRATEYPIRAEHRTSGRPSSYAPDVGSRDSVPAVHATDAEDRAGADLNATAAGLAQSRSNRQAEPAGMSSPPANDHPSTPQQVADDVRRYAPEINWDYAIIQRVNPEDLTSRLIWMSPRKAILEREDAANLELQAGDIVTIFSQRDISVPQNSRSQYVIVEGEVMRPGVYKLEGNETLRSVLRRAGGLSPNSYVYGTLLTRESARVKEQKSLDELAHTMEVQIRQSAAAVAASSQAGELPQMLSAQEAIIAQLHSVRATGRVALTVKPQDHDLTDFPDIRMEDDDRVLIPHAPSTISVVGSVYNPGSFIFQRRNTVEGYLDLAGKGKPQSDLRHAFVVRANGVVVAANNVNGLFAGTKFERLHLYPGDQIVVPYKLPTGAFTRGLRDWTQIASQLAVTGAVIATVLP